MFASLAAVLSWPARAGRLTLLLVSSALLLSCAKDPESAGKEIAEFFCEVARRDDGNRYRMNEKLVDEMQTGKIKTFPQYQVREKELRKEFSREDSVAGVKLKALTTQAEVDFVKEEDRTTMRNTLQAHMKQCAEEQMTQNKDRKKLQLSSLIAKLPLR